MAEITMSQIAKRLEDPSLQRIADRVALEARLAVEKVAASHAAPDQYPLTPDPKSVERILKSLFDALPQAVQQAAATRAIDRIGAPAAERAERYGDLARVDLTSATPVDVQALPFPEALKFPSDHPIVAFNRRRQVPTGAQVLRQRTSSQLELRIHRVKCLDETDGFVGSEAGDDEIYLGGATVDESGDAEKVDAFLVRDDFDDGEEHTYSPPRQFASFDLTEGTEFPKSYFVTLVLFEKDNGGIPELLDKLLMWVKDKVTAYVGSALGGLIGSSGGPVGAAIGAAVGAAVGLLVDFIRDIWEDDQFEPGTLRIDVPSYAHRFANDAMDSPEGRLVFQGHGGEYEVVFDWRLFGQPVLPPESTEQAQLSARRVIYAVEHSRLDPVTGRWTGGELLWYPYRRSELGSWIWGRNAGARVGRRFPAASKVFSGGDGVIYAARELNGDLLWHRHDGWRDGSSNWAANSGDKVGDGWGQFKQVFSGGDGVIYAVQENGDLLWYRHDGWRDGSNRWAEGSGTKVGQGWDFKHVFSGGNGVIYAVQHSRLDAATGRRIGRHLLWYRHDGWRDGRSSWAANSGATVGRYWEHFSAVFSAQDDFVLAVQDNGDLLWYQHDGRRDGSLTWAEGSGKNVGNGWKFSQVFSA